MTRDEDSRRRYPAPRETSQGNAQQTSPPEVPPPSPGEPAETRPRGRTALVVGVAAAVAAAGIAVPLIVRDSRDGATAADRSRTSGDPSELDLGTVTVDELSELLAEHGLILDIAPDGVAVDEDPDQGAVEDGFVDDGSVDGEGAEDDGEFDEPGDAGEFEEPPPLATFSVSSDRLEAGDADPALRERALNLWDRFVELIPSEQRQMLTTFELMDADYQGAHVYQDESDPTKWVLGVGEGLGADVDATLIHEFGHLLTLQTGQVPPDPEAESSCRTYFTGEGCALSSSTFAQFVERFWPEPMLAELEKIDAIEDEDEYFEAQDRFLAQHAGEFVTDYASSNPGEDVAETFTEFVLQDRPTGNDAKDEKIQFLWDDPAMVRLREQIRANR